MSKETEENQKNTTLKAIARERLKRESKTSYSYKHLGHKLIRLPLDYYNR